MSLVRSAIGNRPGGYYFSLRLKRTLSSFAKKAWIRLDRGGVDFPLSFPLDRSCQINAPPLAHDRPSPPGPLLQVEKIDSNTAEQVLDIGAELAACDVYECRFAEGVSDLVALSPRAEHDSRLGRQRADFLKAIWAVLRDDCIAEAFSTRHSAASEALLWTVSAKSDSSVLVMDVDGSVLEVNASGRELLEARTILVETARGLRCANPSETKAFYQALRACAGMDCDEDGDDGKNFRELIIFLEGRNSGCRLPVSLSRFDCEDHAGPLIVAILPKEPDRDRIEMLAMKMGLTPAEARVAALMQLGLSNREAAHIAGLKEQTFNTYAKRALAKLNVRGRTEMAQMLTWQASVGRTS